jgi:hypothetical protein
MGAIFFNALHRFQNRLPRWRDVYVCAKVIKMLFGVGGKALADFLKLSHKRLQHLCAGHGFANAGIVLRGGAIALGTLPLDVSRFIA